MPEVLFRSAVEVAATLAVLLDEWFCNLRVLFVIIDTPLDLKPVDNGMRMQPRWELKDIEGGSFIWDHDHSRFDIIGSENVIDDALYKLTEQINEQLGAELVKHSTYSTRGFEVRPVFAIKT